MAVAHDLNVFERALLVIVFATRIITRSLFADDSTLAFHALKPDAIFEFNARSTTRLQSASFFLEVTVSWCCCSAKAFSAFKRLISASCCLITRSRNNISSFKFKVFFASLSSFIARTFCCHDRKPAAIFEFNALRITRLASLSLAALAASALACSIARSFSISNSDRMSDFSWWSKWRLAWASFCFIFITQSCQERNPLLRLCFLILDIVFIKSFSTLTILSTFFFQDWKPAKSRWLTALERALLATSSRCFLREVSSSIFSLKSDMQVFSASWAFMKTPFTRHVRNAFATCLLCITRTTFFTIFSRLEMCLAAIDHSLNAAASLELRARRITRRQIRSFISLSFSALTVATSWSPSSFTRDTSFSNTSWCTISLRTVSASSKVTRFLSSSFSILSFINSDARSSRDFDSIKVAVLHIPNAIFMLRWTCFNKKRSRERFWSLLINSAWRIARSLFKLIVSHLHSAKATASFNFIARSITRVQSARRRARSAGGTTAAAGAGGGAGLRRGEGPDAVFDVLCPYRFIRKDC